MKYRYGKIALIVGASSGVGKACAEYLRSEGYIVYGTSRKAKFPDGDTNEDRSKIRMIPLDVTKEETIKTSIDYIVKREGGINIVLNCPGYGLAGAVEDISLKEAQEVFNTNFFGIMMVCKNVLPIMRKQKSGLIVNISSVAGFISIPYQSMYSASKYALEAMTEALRIEVKPFGINVSMIEPGDMKTNFLRITSKEALENSTYKERFDKAINEMIRSEMNGPGPEIVVKEFARIINSKNPPIKKTVGWEYNLVGLLKRIIPSRVVENIVAKKY